MSDTKALIERLRDLHMEYGGRTLYAWAADTIEAQAATIARLEAERDAAIASDAESLRMYRSARDRADAARREAMEECAKIIDEKAEAYWAEWDDNADPSSQGSAAACEALLAAIRAAMKGEP